VTPDTVRVEFRISYELKLGSRWVPQIIYPVGKPDMSWIGADDPTCRNTKIERRTITESPWTPVPEDSK